VWMHCFRHRQRDVGGVACVIFSHRFVLSLTRRVCCCNINDFITNMAHSPPPKLWYLPNHRDALQAHMHLLHKLGNAKTEVNYHAYYQTLIKDGTANGATSDAYLTSSDVLFKTFFFFIIKNMRYCSNSQHVKLAPSAHK